MLSSTEAGKTGSGEMRYLKAFSLCVPACVLTEPCRYTGVHLGISSSECECEDRLGESCMLLCM